MWKLCSLNILVTWERNIFSDPSWGGGGEELHTQMGFFVQTFFADRYIHRRELWLVSLESLSSLEYGIDKIFLIFRFLEGVIEV